MGDEGLFFKKWEPGELVSGEEDDKKLGPFSSDVDLVGIFRDPETDAGSANLACSLSRGVEGSDLFHFSGIPSDSILFKPDLAGGRVSPRFNIARGDDVQFAVKASATVTVRWLFLFAAPEASRRSVLDFVRANVATKS